MTNKEAINIIKSECYIFNPLNFDMSTMINTALDMAIKALQEPRWIPVSEKLPENKTYVLTTIKVPNRIAHTRSGWYEGGFFHNDNGDVWRATDMEVIAWMPLPEPYKEESEGEE